MLFIAKRGDGKNTVGFQKVASLVNDDYLRGNALWGTLIRRRNRGVTLKKFKKNFRQGKNNRRGGKGRGKKD